MYAATGDVQSLGGSQAAAQAITDMWYNGELWQYPSSGYGEGTPDMSNFEGWGHYSQVVWASSTGVGCAAQYCAPGTMFDGMGAWFTVCNYSPPGKPYLPLCLPKAFLVADTCLAGNMGGEYGKNVLPPLGNPTVTA